MHSKLLVEGLKARDSFIYKIDISQSSIAAEKKETISNLTLFCYYKRK